MFWLVVSSVCFVPVWGAGPSPKGFVFLPPAMWATVPNKKCIPTVQISTSPVTAKDGETVYYVWTQERADALYKRVDAHQKKFDMELIHLQDRLVEIQERYNKLMKESEERDHLYREKTSQPYKDLK